MIPGWRLGWIVINDRKERFGANVSILGNEVSWIFDLEPFSFSQIRAGLNNLSQRIIGPNALIQGALPEILANTPQEFYDEKISFLQENAQLAFERLSCIPGLTPIRPSGSFYIMVRINVEHFPDFRDDIHFVESLVAEQSVFCLPGNCFEYGGYVRLVLSLPKDVLQEALDRIEEFCLKYHHIQG